MDEITRDVCEVDFPPAAYGACLQDVEWVCQELVARIVRDPEDLIRSGDRSGEDANPGHPVILLSSVQALQSRGIVRRR